MRVNGLLADETMSHVIGEGRNASPPTPRSVPIAGTSRFPQFSAVRSRLGLGLRLVWQTCPQVGLVSAFCACPPTFALDFLHPRPHGRKLVLNFWVPPNWPRGDLHSRADVMSSVPKRAPALRMPDLLQFQLRNLSSPERNRRHHSPSTSGTRRPCRRW